MLGVREDVLKTPALLPVVDDILEVPLDDVNDLVELPRLEVHSSLLVRAVPGELSLLLVVHVRVFRLELGEDGLDGAVSVDFVLDLLDVDLGVVDDFLVPQLVEVV